VLPRFRFAQLLWFVLLICAFSAFGIGHAEAEEGLASWHGPGLEGKPAASGVPYDPNGHWAVSRMAPLEETKSLVSPGERTVPITGDEPGPFVAGGDLNLSQEAAQELELTKVGVGYVEHWRFANPNVPQSLPQGVASQELGLSQGAAQQPGLPQGAAVQLDSSQGGVQDKARGGDYVVQPGDTLSGIALRLGASVEHLARANGIADPNVIYSGQALHLQPTGVDPNFVGGQVVGGQNDFIRRQEGFRLDGYVPDLGFSMSGVTVGTGVDIGQMSVADIMALGIPQELKQKLAPYAGLIGQDAAYFLNNRPLHLTEYEANALDRVVTQNTVEGVARRFNTVAPGNSFAELPPEVRTVIADLAHQYGSDLAQRMPNFWSDVTEGRWKSVMQKLRNFGDRYSTRRNAEADLLQRAFERGAFRHYVVQPGDTLPAIASRLGTSVDNLVRSNGITDPNVIYSGQALYY
jgi:LysM repeat protein